MTTLYDLTVSAYIRALDNVEHVMQKGEQYCKEKGISEEDILAWRFTDDMLPFLNQIQLICNGAKNCLTRVTGASIPPVEDNEKTLAELHARIKHTRSLFENITAAQFEGKDTAQVILPVRGTEIKFTGASYVQRFALPNLYFHATAVYLLFRSHGAPVGKMDYLGGGADLAEVQ